MAINFGTETPWGVPITYKIFYESVETDWDSEHLIEISDIANSADPINNKRKISDVELTLADTDGSIWEGTFANGTGAFNKDLILFAYVGGSMGQVSTDIGVDLKLVNESTAPNVRVHDGKIKEIRREGRSITIRSEDNMGLLKDLRWQPPVRTTPGTIVSTANVYYNEGAIQPIGTLIEKANTFTNITVDEIIGSSSGKEENGTYEFYAAIAEAGVDLDDFQGTGLYDIDPSTGIMDFLETGYTFTDTTFYSNNPVVKLKVVRGGTHFSGNGTTTWDDRIVFPSSSRDASTVFFPIQPIRLRGDPTAVLRHLLFGKMVSDYFDDTNNKGASFTTAQQVTAFQVFDQTIEPSNDLVYPEIEDLVGAGNALFYVGAQNKFEYEPYGPKDLDETLETIGSNEILNVSYSNDINEFYNRVSLTYDWDFKEQEYGKAVGSKLSSWAGTEDRPYVLESKWINNPNQANIVVTRQLSRFKNTLPKINLTTTLAKAGIDLGSLYKLEDVDCKLDGIVAQLIDYKKGFGNSNNIKCKFIDGTSLWLQRGYGKWEGDETPPDMVGIVGAVGSTGIWGTEIGGVGTSFNIDTDKYGTMFVWW